MSLATRLNVRPSATGYPAGATLGPRKLHDFQFVWMISGTALWRWVDTGLELTLEPQTLLLVRPQMRDEFVWDRRRHSRHGFIHFRIDPSPDTSDWPLIRPIAPPGPVAAMLDYLLWLANEPTRAWRTATERTLADVLELFIEGPLPGAEDYRTAEPPPLAAALDHVRREWNQHAMRPIPMSELIEVAAVSREHLTRLFRRHYGLSTVAAMEWVRLGRAANLLTRSDRTVSEIAAICGYADPLHFSRRFRTMYGTSPSTYRRIGTETEPMVTAGLLRLQHRLSRESARTG